VLPGSHRRGRLGRDQINCAQDEITPVNCDVERCDAIAMKPLILHASSPAIAPNIAESFTSTLLLLISRQGWRGCDRRNGRRRGQAREYRLVDAGNVGAASQQLQIPGMPDDRGNDR